MMEFDEKNKVELCRKSLGIILLGTCLALTSSCLPIFFLCFLDGHKVTIFLLSPDTTNMLRPNDVAFEASEI